MLAPTTPSQATSQGLKALLEPARPHLDALNVYLSEQAEAFEPEVRELVHYCLRHTGKQIRPMLVFYSGWQGNGAEPDAGHVKAAAILELVHQATLVHDDILDGASIRHNSATLSEKYDAHTAVLLGDALFSHALKLASEFPTVEVCRIVSLATRRVCAGEIAQTFQHRSPDVTLKDYYRVIDLKTAELFRASCELGARLTDYEDAYVEAAASFGRHLGIAYQIFDDLADLTGSEARIGKTLGTDLESGKFTLPILLLLDKLDGERRQTLLEEMKNGEPDIDTWVGLIHKYQIPEAVEQAFLNELDQAETLLKPFSHLPSVDQLQSLSVFIRQQTAQLRRA